MSKPSLRSVAGATLVAAVVVVALAAPLLYPDDPFDMVARPGLTPGADPDYPLGTDLLGRDLAAGLAHGARATLVVGLIAAALAVALGTAVGAAAGYLRGWADTVLMRATEVFQTMPPFLFAIAFVAALGAEISQVVLAIALTSWPAVARLVRAEVLAVRGREFVQAAVVAGARPSRILLRHVLPNALSPAIVSGSLLVASAVLTEAGLAFLGLSDPNVITWGGMIGAGREALRTHPHMTAVPGVALALVVLGVNLLGDALDDAMDPRRRA